LVFTIVRGGRTPGIKDHGTVAAQSRPATRVE